MKIEDLKIGILYEDVDTSLQLRLVGFDDHKDPELERANKTITYYFMDDFLKYFKPVK